MKKANSPFKFLDAYSREDADIWFGREQETEALYDALSGVKHLLVYGPSGAGKTSLIECGLRNQFSDADWFALTIRRGSNMTASVFAAINDALESKFAIDPDTKLPLDASMTYGEAVERLYAERYQPVYLLFDQFEELLILGKENSVDNQDQRKDFFQRLNELIRYKVPCRVILIMREEFIGHLSEYEHFCPSIFQHRYRLEKMRKDSVGKVILSTLTAKRYQSFFQVQEPKSLASGILAKLPDNKQEIELAHVQVFLDELWERANQKGSNDTLPVISQNLIVADDNLERILDSFLKKQLRELEGAYGEKVPLELLVAMISERHTKLQLSEQELQSDLADKQVKLKKPLSALLKELEKRRVVRTLKSRDKTQYEISHDLLALIIGQNLTEVMKMRERAAEVYRVYEDRQGYYSQEDLDFVRPFERYLAIPAELKKRMQDSEDHWKEENKRELEDTRKRLQIVRGLLVCAILALITAGCLGFWANQQRQKLSDSTEALTKEKETAQTNLNKLRKEEAAKQYLEFNDFEIHAKKILNENNPGGCPADYLEAMRNIAQKHPDADSLMLFDRIKTIQNINPNCR